MEMKKILPLAIIFIFILSSIAPISIGYNIGISIEKKVKVDKGFISNENGNDIDWWPMISHDSANTGYSTSTGPETNRIGWSYDVGGFPYSPVIIDDKVYCGVAVGPFPDSHSIFCLDADTGEKIWSYKPSNCNFPGCITYAYGNLYFGGNANKGTYKYYFICLDAENGNIVWRFSKDTWFGFCGDGGPAVADGKVYIGEISYISPKFYCLDAFSGDIIWSYQLSSDYIGLSETPAVANGKVYFFGFANSGPGKVYCLDANTGEYIWSCGANAFTNGGPTISDGKIYYKSTRWDISCRNADTGEYYWTFETENVIRWPFAVAYGNVYFGSRDKKIYCVNADTGSFVWSYKTGELIINSPAVADGKVYIGSYDNYVYCLDAYTGDYIWSYETGHDITFKGSAAIANDKLYIGSGDNKLYCFDGGSFNAPSQPTIEGPTLGRIGIKYNYKFKAEDPQGDNIYYYIEWNDGTNEEWLGPYSSGEEITVSHIWSSQGTYTIRAKAKDTNDEESTWGILTVTMPRNKIVNRPFLNFLENHPIMFQLFQRFLNL